MSLEATVTLDAINNLPENTPIYMLNLVKLHAAAQYPASSAMPACTGAQAYLTRYIPAFRKIAHDLGDIAEPIYAGHEPVNVIALPGESWDLVALVKYRDVEAFKAVTRSQEYKETAAPHREAAIKEWKLIGSVKMGL